jgi:drug/metabolite transporter (DMT)-like permease
VVVLFGALAGVFFGALPVSVRHALRRYPDAEVAAALLLGLGFCVTAAAAALAGVLDDLGGAWPFVLIGALAPGLMQPFAVRAVRAAGAARASVVISTFPLMSVTLAVLLLDEHLSLAVAVGVVLIVAGCVALASEGQRPADFRPIGLVLAFAGAVMLATRDNLVRWVSVDASVAPLAAATLSLLGASAFLFAFLVLSPQRRALRGSVRAGGVAFVVPGLLVGAGTVSLYAAFDHGPVTTVAPLNATSALWTVVFATLLMRRREGVTRQLVLAAALVVAGGVLIGASA